MNIVFWILVVIICLIAWYLLSNVFSKIGEIATKIISKIKNNINHE